MSKSKKRKSSNISVLSRQGVLALCLVFLMAFSVIGSGGVQADKYEAQIKELQKQNNQTEEHKHDLLGEAVTLSGAIANLQKEIDLKQQAINESQKEITRLKKEIVAAEIELKKQKGLLSDIIRAIYVEGDISTVEMLASSDDLADFFDQQQYRESVSTQVKTTLDKVNQLKLDLSTKKDKTEKLLKGQTNLKNQMLGQRSEKNRLLSLNSQERKQLEGQMRKNSAKIAVLERKRAEAQAALNRSLNSGSYKVSPAGYVRAGDVVGAIGNTGLSSGPHLHLEARRGGVINPEPYIKSEPVNRPPAYISQGYGARNPLYASGYHGGIDYASYSGSPIFAIDSGNMYRGCSDQMLGTRNNAYGYVAIVEHGNGVISIYAHMSGGPSACNYNTYY